MSEQKINKQHQATFDGLRHVDEAGNEYWLARQLSKVLEYSQYRHFVPVLERAREAGRNSGQRMEDHMEDILTMVDIGSGAQREVDDVRLSRYGRHLHHRTAANTAHACKAATLNSAILKDLKQITAP